MRAYGKFIGKVEGGVFKKRAKLSKHLYKNLDAWGIDGRYFRDVLLPNNYSVEITETEEGKTYTATAEEINKNGQYYHFKREEDHGAQIFLPRRYWVVK